MSQTRKPLRRWTALSLALVMTFVIGAAQAQGQTGPPPAAVGSWDAIANVLGRTVAVDTTDGGRTKGILLGVEVSSVVVEVAGSRRALNRADVLRVSIRGRLPKDAYSFRALASGLLGLLGYSFAGAASDGLNHGEMVLWAAGGGALGWWIVSKFTRRGPDVVLYEAARL